MAHLETQLKRAEKSRFKMIATDGVFSMDGDVALLADICDLAERRGMGNGGRFPCYRGLRADGAGQYRAPAGDGTGGYHHFDLRRRWAARRAGSPPAARRFVELLRQRSRPYLFSNSLSPVIAAVTLKVIDKVDQSPHLVKKLQSNTIHFRGEIARAGFNIRPGEHPIIPIMLGEASLAHEMADELLKEGIYVIGFSYPVVPKGEASIRIQVSAGHETPDLDQAVAAFKKIGSALELMTPSLFPGGKPALSRKFNMRY